MPELPEVEVTVRGLKPIIKNKIKAFQIFNSSLRWPVDYNLCEILKNQIILKVERRAKYILINLLDGYLIIHLGMTGKLTFADSQSKRKKHDHIEIHFENDSQVIRYNDPRRFGSIHFTQGDLKNFFLLKNLGVEPLSENFDTEYLFKKTRLRKQKIKALIMNHQVVVGVGNIYASEALFMSNIRPSKKASSVSKKNINELVKNIKKILKVAIQKGGSTLNDFINTNGESGYFQIEHKVYGRAGSSCVNCSSLIKKIVIGQRSSFYCPTCQH